MTYTIGEFAKLTNFSIDTLRKYSEISLHISLFLHLKNNPKSLLGKSEWSPANQ
ncbi:hypothetical protein NRIC_36030 [Enterococcus florum]|uniref:Uncharacterized protein n=1 Tax=Enterococcus florum TaxID=2480627 RepID=A0A4P5PJE6_9ENTE|nr:hypothetical protein NRIC_36030 [Enterococcus florum]